MSYNQQQQNKYHVFRLFFPGVLSMSAEAVTALVVLFFLNIYNIGSRFLDTPSDNVNPVEFSGQLLDKFWGTLNDSYLFQQVSLFILWALAGMFAYILIFRLIQAVTGVSYSVKDGWRHVKAEHTRGLLSWLGSLHDFFIKLLIFAAGAALFGYGTLVCFSLANQQLAAGLSQPYPANIAPLVISAVSAIIGIRIMIIGLCLLSRNLRNFYCS